MALTMGGGPFGHHPAGLFNFTRSGPDAVIYWERSPRRVRVEFGGEIVADTRDARLLHESRHLPVYYLPRRDVRAEVLESSDRRTHCPWKGDAAYWSLRVGDRLAEHAVWSYPEPLAHAPAEMADYVAFDWDAVDAFYEDADRLHGHPRDPYHRIDVVPAAHRVTVSFDGQVLADSERAFLLYETGLPPRHYLPVEDVRTEALEPSDTRTTCAYKGFASYWSVRGTGDAGRDLVWGYQPGDTLRDGEAVVGLMCFYDEKVDVAIDSQPVPRPQSLFG